MTDERVAMIHKLVSRHHTDHAAYILPAVLYSAVEDLLAEVERLKLKVKQEYDRGLEEGGSAQAIIEIAGRERFTKELKAKLLQKAAST